MDIINRLPELRVFHIAAENLSMTSAAKQLFLTQPAVSHNTAISYSLEPTEKSDLLLKVNFYSSSVKKYLRLFGLSRSN